MRQLYCGGAFPFDPRSADYCRLAAGDYRAVLLGSRELLMQRSAGIPLNRRTTYIGPFYYETPDMRDVDIVRDEMEMIRRCTDAVFLLDDAACPGTVCELTAAAMLHKRLHIFYLRRDDDQETESALHSPCWYPIIHSTIINTATSIHACHDYVEAVRRITELVRSWDPDHYRR